MTKMRAVRVVGYHSNLELHEVDKLEPAGPFDVIVRIGGAGVLHRPAHPRGPVGGEVERRVAVQHRPRERRLGGRGLCRGHERAEGDKVIVHPLVTCGLCRARCPVTTSTVRTASSPGSTPRRVRRVPQRRRAAW